jgi:PAS domain S-box-containing protein
MAESAKSNNDVPLEAAIPEEPHPLESILCTEALHRRPWRPPDYGKENRALVALAIPLADSPRTILHTLAEKALEVLQADSAGLSLLTNDEQRFYWAAIAGAWQPHLGGGTPRDFGPCGDVLDRNVPMLFTHWERRYPYLRPATPLAEEGLLVPFHVHGKAVGTIWAIAHNDRRQFDAEDLRLLESLGRFASAAYQALASIDDLTVQIAAREKAEAALRERAHGLEAKIRRLVDATIIGICLWHLDGRILEANDASLRLVGYDRGELVSGRVRWREGTPDTWRAADEGALAELAATGSCAPFETEYVRQDGRRVPVLVGAALFEGRRDEGVAFVLDVSERKRAEAALHQAQMELAHVSRVATLGELAASIAHEITQPLGALVNSANACVRWLAAQNPERARQSALAVVADGERAADIIGRIRALAQKAPLEKEWLDLNATIREVIALARSAVQRHGVVVETHLAKEVPRILGDRVQLQQVLLNLVMNAIEALRGVGAGSRALWVSSERVAATEVVIAVRDSGPGFDPGHLDRLFDAFYTTKPEGMGLGLAISRRIIAAHGGRLWATAHPPHGATVQFTLPIGREGVA